MGVRTPGPPGVPASVARSPPLVSHRGVGPCQGSPTSGGQNCLSGSRGCHTCLAPWFIVLVPLKYLGCFTSWLLLSEEYYQWQIISLSHGDRFQFMLSWVWDWVIWFYLPPPFNSCKQNLKAAGRLLPKISFSEQKSLVFCVQWCVSCKLFMLIYKALHGLQLSDETVLITAHWCCLPDCLGGWISFCQSQSISPLFFCLLKFSFHDKNYHCTEAL